MAMERIGDILLEMKACTPEELSAGLQTQVIFGGRIGTTLLELGIIDETQLAAALTRAYRMPCLTGDIQPEPAAIASVAPELVERLGFVPLQIDERRLKVVVSDPTDLTRLDDVAFATGRKIEPVLATEHRVWELMHRLYGIDKQLRGVAVEEGLELEPTAHGDPGAAARDPDQIVLESRLPSVADAIERMDGIDDPVVLSALLVRVAGARTGRTVFLKCRGAAATAWLAAGRQLGAADPRKVEIPLERESPFGAAAELRAPVLAPLAPPKGAAPLFAALGGALPMNAFVAPVILRGRTVGLLYADAGPGATLRGEAADLIALTGALNRRFEVLAPMGAASSEPA